MDVEALARATGAASTIARAADSTGVDFSYLMNAAMRESAFKANAKNPRSSATGMFQFIEQTWLAMVKRHGDKHGMAEMAHAVKMDGDGKYYVANAAQRREILNLRTDPEASAKLAGELTAENAEYLIDKLGRPPTDAELYAAHVLGSRHAARLAQAAEEYPNTRAASMFPVAARGNKSLFYASNGRALNAAEALQAFGKVSTGLDQVAPGAPLLTKGQGLRGRFQEDESGDARTAYLNALVSLQAQPIGFNDGGFGDSSEERDRNNSKMLLRAFTQEL